MLCRISWTILVFGLITRLAAAAASCTKGDTYFSTNGPYTFLANQLQDDSSGVQCLSTSNNDTRLSVTWRWSNNQDTVHSFPGVQLRSELFPLPAEKLNRLNITANWTMSPNPKLAAGLDIGGLTAIGAQAAVLVEVLLDPEMSRSLNRNLARARMLVWLGDIGGVVPAGFGNPFERFTEKIGSTNFTLYSSQNTLGQSIHTWYPAQNITVFNNDITPMVKSLVQHNLIDKSCFLGSAFLGTETYNSRGNVTFTLQNFAMGLDTSSKGAAAGTGAFLSRSLAIFASLLAVLFVL